jgi:hypothetical protein
MSTGHLQPVTDQVSSFYFDTYDKNRLPAENVPSPSDVKSYLERRM